MALPAKLQDLFTNGKVPQAERHNRVLGATETGEIFSTLTDSEQAKQVLELLLRGPTTEGLVGTIPPTTRLREIYLSPEGTAFADFSRDLADKHGGGSHAEIATIYSIIDSLAYNVPRIRRVQILLDGHEVHTLAGHIGLWLPLVPEYDFVDRTPTKAAPARPAEKRTNI